MNQRPKPPEGVREVRTPKGIPEPMVKFDIRDGSVFIRTKDPDDGKWKEARLSNEMIVQMLDGYVVQGWCLRELYKASAVVAATVVKISHDESSTEEELGLVMQKSMEQLTGTMKNIHSMVPLNTA